MVYYTFLKKLIMGINISKLQNTNQGVLANSPAVLDKHLRRLSLSPAERTEVITASLRELSQHRESLVQGMALEGMTMPTRRLEQLSRIRLRKMVNGVGFNATAKISPQNRLEFAKRGSALQTKVEFLEANYVKCKALKTKIDKFNRGSLRAASTSNLGVVDDELANEMAQTKTYYVKSLAETAMEATQLAHRSPFEDNPSESKLKSKASALFIKLSNDFIATSSEIPESENVSSETREAVNAVLISHETAQSAADQCSVLRANKSAASRIASDTSSRLRNVTGQWFEGEVSKSDLLNVNSSFLTASRKELSLAKDEARIRTDYKLKFDAWCSAYSVALARLSAVSP
jgi:hypothetical protein